MPFDDTGKRIILNNLLAEKFLVTYKLVQFTLMTTCHVYSSFGMCGFVILRVFTQACFLDPKRAVYAYGPSLAGQDQQRRREPLLDTTR